MAANIAFFNRTFLMRDSSQVMGNNEELILFAICCGLPGIFLALLLCALFLKRSREFLLKDEDDLLPDFVPEVSSIIPGPVLSVDRGK